MSPQFGRIAITVRFGRSRPLLGMHPIIKHYQPNHIFVCQRLCCQDSVTEDACNEVVMVATNRPTLSPTWICQKKDFVFWNDEPAITCQNPSSQIETLRIPIPKHKAPNANSNLLKNKTIKSITIFLSNIWHPSYFSIQNYHIKQTTMNQLFKRH